MTNVGTAEAAAVVQNEVERVIFGPGRQVQVIAGLIGIFQGRVAGNDAFPDRERADGRFQYARVGKPVSRQPLRAGDEGPSLAIIVAERTQGQRFGPISRLGRSGVGTDPVDAICRNVGRSEAALDGRSDSPSFRVGGGDMIAIGCLPPAQHFRERGAPSSSG